MWDKSSRWASDSARATYARQQTYERIKTSYRATEVRRGYQRYARTFTHCPSYRQTFRAINLNDCRSGCMRPSALAFEFRGAPNRRARTRAAIPTGRQRARTLAHHTGPQVRNRSDGSVGGQSAQNRSEQFEP